MAKVISLADYRRTVEGRKADEARALEKRIQRLEMECLKTFYSERHRFDLVSSAELYRIDPNHPFALIGKSIVAYDEADYTGCMPPLEIAAELYPNNREVAITTAMMYMNLSRTCAFRRADAEAFARHVVREYPDDPEMLDCVIRLSLFGVRDPGLCMDLLKQAATDMKDREMYEAHLGILIRDLELEKEREQDAGVLDDSGPDSDNQ